MTVTTNYLVTGNGITGSTANAVQALVSGDGILAQWILATGRVGQIYLGGYAVYLGGQPVSLN